MALHGLRRTMAIAASFHLNGLGDAVPYYLAKEAGKRSGSGGIAVARGSFIPNQKKEESWDEETKRKLSEKLRGSKVFREIEEKAIAQTEKRILPNDKMFTPLFISSGSDGNSLEEFSKLYAQLFQGISLGILPTNLPVNTLNPPQKTP